MGKKIRIISRQSRLALLQVEELVKEAGITDYELIKTTSYGDRHKEVSLMDEGLAQDFFTRELDEALLEGRADIAVHSAKDLPNPLPDGIELLALTEGKDPSDSLVAHDGLTLATLPAGSKVGTSSAQRKEELLKVRPDLVVVPIRGTIEERIAQVDSGAVDALIVATCALDRLGLSHRATERLPFKTHPLQGKLAVTGRHYGKVWLVGYGPGDPELITVKGQRLLKEADVVFYDDLSFVPVLAPQRVLRRFAEPVKVPVQKYIYVGKRSGKHSHSQEEINELMYQAATEGKTVVRLKGGDPMVFAHGREEIDYLQSRFVKVEVVPGISSGIALASLTQIPLTHRGLARSAAFVLGHAKDIQTPTADTLIYYMGGAKVSEIAHSLIASGRSPETPVALVTNVSLPNQRTVFTSLGEMKWALFKATPVLIVVGEVVALEAKTHKSRVYDTSSTSETPLIKIEHLPFISNSNMDILEFDYIVFTSRHGVKHFFEEYNNCQLSSELCSPEHLWSARIVNSQLPKIISVGSFTTAALRERGIEPFFESPTQSARGIIDFFRDKPRGSRILLARSDKGLKALTDGLRQHEVTDLPVYSNRPDKDAVKQDLTQYDKILFSSPSGVEAFRDLYGITKDKELQFDGLIIAKGETTYEAIQTV